MDNATIPLYTTTEDLSNATIAQTSPVSCEPRLRYIPM